MREIIAFFVALGTAVLPVSCHPPGGYDEHYSACLRQTEKFFFEIPETGEKGFGYADYDPKCIVGAPLPIFDLRGGLYPMNNDSLYGKPSVIYFWMTSCKPCLKHIEALNNLAENSTFKESVNFISITTEGEEKLRRFLYRKAFLFKNYCEAQEVVHERFKLLSPYPVTVITNAENIITEVFVGSGTADHGLLVDLIDEQLQSMSLLE